MSGAQNIVIAKGRTVPIEALPDHSAALDGYVQGPFIDAGRRRFSFDHHVGCIRHATLSSCEMVLDAIRVGLEPADLTIYINDLDEDTVLAAWLLTCPEAAASEAVAWAVRAAGRADALGPAVGGPGVVPALRWAMAPMSARRLELRTLDLIRWREILDSCFERLRRWWLAGAPVQDEEMPAPERSRVAVVTLHDGGSWRLVEGPGVGAMASIYASGCMAGGVARQLDATWEYTIGKASEFVAGFDVPAILAALREAERAANPDQDEASSWGGGSTIGGSPRNADGSASCLGPPQVVAVIQRVVAESAEASRVEIDLG